MRYSTDDIDAMAAEVARRYDDPNRQPIELRKELPSSTETQRIVDWIEQLPADVQDRVVNLIEDIASKPEPERTQQIEWLHIAVDVVKNWPDA